MQLLREADIMVGAIIRCGFQLTALFVAYLNRNINMKYRSEQEKICY